MLLAIATKQRFLVAPIAVCLGVWPAWQTMLGFTSLVVGGAGLGLVGAEWFTNGWFVWHTVIANSNKGDLVTFAALMGSFLQFNGLPVLAAAASLVLPAGRSERLWRLYFLGCLAMLPTIAKLGSSSNYWLELSAATAVLLALASHHLAHHATARLVAPLVLSGALLTAMPAYQASAMEAADTVNYSLRAPSPRYLSLVSDAGTAPYRVDVRFVEHVAREPGELLTDNPGLAVAAGKRIAFEFQIFQLL